MISETRIPASYKDDCGYVFEKENVLYRRFSPKYARHYRKLMDSGLYQQLVEKGLLIAHEEIEVSEAGGVLKPVRVPFITYPYEWSFHMLKDAALATLRIQKLALKHAMILKDASAFNIQFFQGRPLLIDTLSFEIYDADAPWKAYGQFCKHFLAPLLLGSFVDERLLRMSQLETDGVALDLASSMLPLKAKLDFSVMLHLGLQSQKKNSQKASPSGNPRIKLSKQRLEAICENLQDLIAKLEPAHKGQSLWSGYYGDCSYTEPAMAAKVSAVERYLNIVKPRTVFDIGANTGRFSRLAAEKGALTVAMDYDHMCVDAIYHQAVEEKIQNLIPLVLDASNPTPAIGWALTERDSIMARGPADMIVALALIHHLAIGKNVPLSFIADCFARLGRHLVIEFVPKSDPMVQTLLATREDIFPSYNLDSFLESFQASFELIERNTLPQSDRKLFLFRSRLLR